MGHHNALEFLRVDFVYPTGSLFCDLSRHAVFRDAALTIGWSDEPHFSYLPPIWPVLLTVDFNSYSASRFLFLTITWHFTLESRYKEQLNEDPKDWQNMLAIKRFCYIEVPFNYCTVKPRSSMETAQYRHLIVTDSLLCPWGKKAFTFSTRLIRSPR